MENGTVLTNKEILERILVDNNISYAEFGRIIGLPGKPTQLYDIRDGKIKSITAKMADKILSAFPRYNRVWLLTGTGERYDGQNEGEAASPKDTPDAETPPRVPCDAEAGTLTEAVDGVTGYQCERVPVIRAFPRFDFTIRVTGRSMEPAFRAGDEVACLRVSESQFIQWGRTHVLDTAQGVVIKRIYDEGDRIRCVSCNPEFPDFTVSKADIRSINLVVGSIRIGGD